MHHEEGHEAALVRALTCQEITNLNEQFALINTQKLVYSPETEEALQAAENLAALRAYATSIHAYLGDIDAHISQQLPVHTVMTKTKLAAAIHFLIERTRGFSQKAIADVSAEHANLAKFFKHTGKAYKRKCRVFSALAHLDPTKVDLVDQTLEGGMHWLGSDHGHEGLLADAKDLVAMGIGALFPLKLDRDIAALEREKDSALLERIATYAKSPATPEVPGFAGVPPVDDTPVARITESAGKVVQAAIGLWPQARDLAVRSQGIDATKFRDHLLIPVDAQVTTFLGRFVAPAADTSLGRWLTSKVGQHPALPAASSAYLNGVRALRTLLVAKGTCTEAEFDAKFREVITQQIDNATTFLRPESLKRVVGICDGIMPYAPACEAVCKEFTTHARIAQTETDEFLAFLKALGECDAAEVARFALLST